MMMDALATSPPVNESIWAVHMSVTGSIITALLYGVVFLVGALLNPIIIAVIVVKKRLREPSFIFLFSLAVVDFSEVFLSTPFYIATHIGQEWIIGTTDEEKRGTCEMVGFFVTLFLSVSVHILALIAFDRFFYIVFAVKYHKFLKQWIAWLLVLSVFFICVIISSPPLYGFGELFFFQTAGACLFRWRGSGSNYQYVLFYSVEVLIPISAIFLFTLITFCYIKRHLHKRNKRELEWTTKEHKVKPKVAVLNRIFGLLLITQIICFGPALSTVLVGAIISFENIPDVVLLIDLILVLSNGAINPVIQAIVWKQVRTVMCKCCKTTKMESPESSRDQMYNRQLTTVTAVDDSLK